MVALEEVGYLALTQFWVSYLSSRSCSAENEVSSFPSAGVGTLVRVDELLDPMRAGLEVEILTLNLCLSLTYLL